MTTASTQVHPPAYGDSATAPEQQPVAVKRRGLKRNFAQLLGSNALISLTGLACLPVLFRNLGAAKYGDLSLFLTALALLASLDISRPTLVREWSREGGAQQTPRLGSLVGASQLLLTPLSLLLGWIAFGPVGGIALGLATFLYVAASAPYATLAAQDRVGRAAAVRNHAWVGAFLLATGLSFAELPTHAVIWPFVAANLVILLVNQRLSGCRRSVFGQRPHVATWKAFSNQSWNILGLSLATAVVVSADKLILKGNNGSEVFGHYAAQYDLAIKLNILGSALGTILLPALSRDISHRGFEVAAQRFVRQASWLAAGFFCLLTGLLLCSEQVLRLILGEDALQVTAVYPLFLVGVFFALFGHLITPWQRACGDFRTHRRIYGVSAGLMLVVGFVLIPKFGALGAVLTYLSARSADVMLVASEVRRIPESILPRRRIMLLGSMAVLLTCLGIVKYLQLGGAA